MDNPIKKINLGNINFAKEGIYKWWQKYQWLIFGIIFLIIIATGAFYWYFSLYKFSWDENRKKEYLEKQSQQVNLEEEKFKKVIEEFEKRKRMFQSEPPIVKDIFKSYD